MTRDAAIQSYCRMVGQKLTAPAHRKRKILAGLRQELEERFPAPDGLTLEEISDAVGPAAETAYSLMESVPPEERERHRVWKKRLVCCVIAVLVVLLVVSAAFFVHTWNHRIVRTEETITYYPDGWTIEDMKKYEAMKKSGRDGN